MHSNQRSRIRTHMHTHSLTLPRAFSVCQRASARLYLSLSLSLSLSLFLSLSLRCSDGPNFNSQFMKAVEAVGVIVPDFSVLDELYNCMVDHRPDRSKPTLDQVRLRTHRRLTHLLSASASALDLSLSLPPFLCLSLSLHCPRPIPPHATTRPSPRLSTSPLTPSADSETCTSL